MWLPLNSACRGCPLLQQAQRPGIADNDMLLAGVAVCWRRWCYCGVGIHAGKLTTCCVSRGSGRPGFEIKLTLDWFLGFSRTQHTGEELLAATALQLVPSNELRQSAAAGSSDGPRPRNETATCWCCSLVVVLLLQLWRSHIVLDLCRKTDVCQTTSALTYPRPITSIDEGLRDTQLATTAGMQGVGPPAAVSTV